MKRFDDNTKKLIKNVVSLLTSALVLVAATVAWFNATNTNTFTRGFRGSMQNTNYSATYFRLKTVSGTLNSAATGYGGSAGFSFSTNPTIPDSVMPSDLWNPVSGEGAWNINSLIPGKYDGFRIDISNTAPVLIIRNITCTDANDQALTAAQLETVYKNVYLYAIAVQTTTDDTQTPPVDSYSVMTTVLSQDVIVCDSLYNLFSGVGQTGFNVSNSQTITTLTGADPALTSANGSSTILLFIGVPGSSVTVPSGSTAPDLVAEHDALRQIGAKLSLGSFAVAAS